MPPIWIMVVFLMIIWLWIITFVLVKIYRKLSAIKTNSSSSISANLPDLSSFFRYYQLVKFNPFPDTGGEQSFIFTLLNGKKDGIILTSLHGRGVTRFYAKKISAGNSSQELSSEEKQALIQALKPQP